MGLTVDPMCEKFRLDPTPFEPREGLSLVSGRKLQQAFIASFEVYLWSSCMAKCCQMNGPLVDKMCVKLELDPSSYEPPASYFPECYRKFQQAFKA